LGVKPKRIRYSAICVHLDHKRGYVTDDMLANSRRIREHTKASRKILATVGIDRYLPGLEGPAS
jgi:predicted membrane GTPase involved in stress response